MTNISFGKTCLKLKGNILAGDLLDNYGFPPINMRFLGIIPRKLWRDQISSEIIC